MLDLLNKIKLRLAQGAFPNEASVSHGIRIPLLQHLGWDPAEPDQVMPEYASGKGRVDFALCTSAGRPAVFVEVKGVGRSLDGDRQLFEYAFHEGVPICVLTDGREWSFYLPGGQGSYDDRRVYRLQLDDRSAEDSQSTLRRYLNRDRVRTGAALEAATTDYRDASAKREAARSIPAAWRQIVSAPEDLLVELVSDQAEALGGFRPAPNDVLDFLRALDGTRSAPEPPTSRATPSLAASATERTRTYGQSRSNRSIEYIVKGESKTAKNGNEALVDILAQISRSDIEHIPTLAKAVQGNSRNHIAKTVQEIYPARPDLARAAEFAPGWLVGLNIANREKMSIIRKACDVFGLTFGTDVKISLPNE